MIFRFFSDPLTATEPIIQRLNQELHANRSVLWLVSGGSNIKLEVAIMNALAETRLANLTVMLMDERYGKYGHADSNFQQLLEAGFDSRDATLLSTLSEDNLSFEDAAARFESTVAEQLTRADVVVGLFGMGPDGHTAGILPGSPAAADLSSLTTHYPTEQYDRLTMTFTALRKIDFGYLYAFGDSKRLPLQQLRDSDTALSEQPVQILKQLKDSIVISDQIGDDE